MDCLGPRWLVSWCIAIVSLHYSMSCIWTLLFPMIVISYWTNNSIHNEFQKLQGRLATSSNFFAYIPFDVLFLPKIGGCSLVYSADSLVPYQIVLIQVPCQPLLAHINLAFQHLKWPQQQKCSLTSFVLQDLDDTWKMLDQLHYSSTRKMHSCLPSTNSIVSSKPATCIHRSSNKCTY